MSKRKQKIIPQSQKAAPGATTTKAKTVAGHPAGINSMINWLVVLLFILPFLYSETPLDTAVSVRYIFLCLFIILFVLYFFVWKQRPTVAPTLLIKITFITGAAFALWSLLSLTGAINYHEGYYEISRHLLHLVLLFIIMTAVMQEPAQLLKICCIVTVVALLQSIVGILQFYEIAFTELPGNFKPYGFMTNRNLFGSAQAFLLPFAIYVFYAAKGSWRITAGTAIIGIIVSLILSQTRSSWLSGIAIFISSAVLVLVFVPSMRKKWMLSSLAGTAVVAVIVSLLILTDKESSLAKSVTERAASLTTTSSSASGAEANISERLKMWRKTVTMIKTHPFTGVGPGNWKVVIPSYGLANTGFADGFYAPDRVHNTYLQTAAETGVPGAIFYFGMWVFIAWAGIITIRKTSNDNKKVLLILMLGGLCAVATDAMFSFPNERIEHSLYMLLMAAIILGIYATEQPTGNVKSYVPGRIILIPVLILVAFNLFLGKKKFDFERHLKMALYYNNLNRSAESLNEAEKGKNSFFTIDLSGNAIELYSGLAHKQMKNYDAAIREFKAASGYSPYNSRPYNNLGTVYWDMKDYPAAIDQYKKALVYTPEFTTVQKNLAMCYYQVGNYAECINAIEKLKIEGDLMLINVLNDCRRKLAAKQ